MGLEIEFYVLFAVIISQQLCTVVDLISHSGFDTSKRLLFFYFNIYTQHGWITPCCCLQGQWKVYKMYQYHRLNFFLYLKYHITVVEWMNECRSVKKKFNKCWTIKLQLAHEWVNSISYKEKEVRDSEILKIDPSPLIHVENVTMMSDRRRQDVILKYQNLDKIIEQSSRTVIMQSESDSKFDFFDSLCLVPVVA